jgi:hypothetical protein
VSSPTATTATTCIDLWGSRYERTPFLDIPAATVTTMGPRLAASRRRIRMIVGGALLLLVTLLWFGLLYWRSTTSYSQWVRGVSR